MRWQCVSSSHPSRSGGSISPLDFLAISLPHPFAIGLMNGRVQTEQIERATCLARRGVDLFPTDTANRRHMRQAIHRESHTNSELFTCHQNILVIVMSLTRSCVL